MSKQSSKNNPYGLRVVHGCESSEEPSGVGLLESNFELPAAGVNRVAVSAGEAFQLLEDAASTNRAWLSDFADDTIEVSQDLYEVLIAYKRLVYHKAA